MSDFAPDGMGGLNLNDGDIKLPTKEQRYEERTVKRYADRNHRGKFRLVTVRQITDLSPEDIQAKLEETQANLEDAALRTGRPFPHPTSISMNNEEITGQAYGVYIDEDLFGLDKLIYTFVYEPGSQIRCYIHATGDGREDWTVHIVHELIGSRKNNISADSSIKNIGWRIVTIESNYQYRMMYFLENSAWEMSNSPLPQGYSYNYSIDNLHYLGGGTWTGLCINPDDRIPIYALASADNNRYTPMGKVMRSLGQSRVHSLVSYSCTPSCSFTWNKDKLEVTYRKREAKQEIDWNSYKIDRILKFTRSHSYSLDINIRLKDWDNPNKHIQQCTYKEFSKGKATYVGNTNNPVTPSRYQSIDYGTDSKRLAIQEYSMETNVIRTKPTLINRMPNKAKVSVCNPCHIPVLAATPDMSLFILHDIVDDRYSASGNMSHSNQKKTTQGSRTFQYGDSYKYWWGYGAITTIQILSDVVYRIVKTARGEQPSRVPIGKMTDRGEIKIDNTCPNRIITTWDSEPNPPTGFFGIEEGLLAFKLTYVNPPILGHDSIYYYEINPEPVPDSGGDIPNYDNMIGAAREEGNFLKNMYTQLLGALGAGGLNSLDIGEITLNQFDNNTLLARAPTTTQFAHMIENPEHFPVGYFESDFIEFDLDTNNKGYYAYYNSDGSLIKKLPFIDLIKKE